MTLHPDLEIARRAKILPIEEIAAKLNIGDDDLEHYGKHTAKISLDLYRRLATQPTGKLVLVTAVTPTPAGEGKTTTSVGLCDGLNRIGKRTTVCLREPSLGPCFGMKGGAAGGGYAQVAPMEDINLHFTGDFHAIELAHNLLAAMLDNHIHHGNQLGIDPRRIVWRRVVDMNDRALRDIIVGLGGVNNSVPHESGYDITVASEVMAVFCLSESLKEMKERLGRIIVAYTRDKKPITAADLKAHGAMTALMKHAIKPNLAQTLEIISDTVRDRIRIKQEIKVFTSQQTLTGVMLALLPVGLVVVLMIINPDYMRRLFDPGITRIMLIGAIVMETVGFLVMRKILAIEV